MRNLVSKVVAALGVILYTIGVSQGASLNAHIAYIAYNDGYWQAWTMTTDGRNHRQITRTPYDKSRISWYPDGRYLLVNNSQGGLAKVDIETGHEIPIRVSLAGVNDGMVSPDGEWIAVSFRLADGIDNNDIWIVKSDGTGLRRLTNMKGLQHEPSWGPDGNWIYFLSGTGGQTHDIWRVSPSSKKAEQLTVGQLYHFDVAVSPDGDLAFSSNRTGNYEIWVKRGKENARALTNHPALDARPTWSPDGRTVVFESTREGAPNIWKMALQNGSPVKLTKHRDGARAPVWQQSMTDSK